MRCGNNFLYTRALTKHTTVGIVVSLYYTYAKANVSAKETSPRPPPWVPYTHVYPHRPSRAEAASPKRTPPTNGLARMLPSSARLTRGDFPALYRRGLRRRSRSFTWWQLATRPTSETRYGVVVSTKVSRRAVDRNLYKRRLWACLKILRPQLPRTGYAIVVSANSSIAGRPYADVFQELAGFVENIHFRI